MTPGERLTTLEMIHEATAHLLRGDSAIVDRHFELLRRQNDADRSDP